MWVKCLDGGNRRGVLRPRSGQVGNCAGRDARQNDRMTGLWTGGSRPPRQKSGFDGDPSHFDPVYELAIKRGTSTVHQAHTLFLGNWAKRAILSKNGPPCQNKAPLSKSSSLVKAKPPRQNKVPDRCPVPSAEAHRPTPRLFSRPYPPRFRAALLRAEASTALASRDAATAVPPRACGGPAAPPPPLQPHRPQPAAFAAAAAAAPVAAVAAAAAAAGSLAAAQASAGPAAARALRAARLTRTQSPTPWRPATPRCTAAAAQSSR
eukprot:349597-Chlamydomonas_euryale.AAC.1